MSFVCSFFFGEQFNFKHHECSHCWSCDWMMLTKKEKKKRIIDIWLVCADSKEELGNHDGQGKSSNWWVGNAGRVASLAIDGLAGADILTGLAGSLVAALEVLWLQILCALTNIRGHTVNLKQNKMVKYTTFIEYMYTFIKRDLLNSYQSAQSFCRRSRHRYIQPNGHPLVRRHRRMMHR